MSKLIPPCKSHLECNAESFDSHDRDRAGCRANREVDEGISLAILGRNVVDHKDGESRDKDAIDEES